MPPRNVTNVRVQRSDWTDATYPRCVERKLQDGWLYVVSLDFPTAYVMHRYAPGQWQRAIITDDSGQPVRITAPD